MCALRSCTARKSFSCARMSFPRTVATRLQNNPCTRRDTSARHDSLIVNCRKWKGGLVKMGSTRFRRESRKQSYHSLKARHLQVHPRHPNTPIELSIFPRSCQINLSHLHKQQEGAVTDSSNVSLNSVPLSVHSTPLGGRSWLTATHSIPITMI